MLKLTEEFFDKHTENLGSTAYYHGIEKYAEDKLLVYRQQELVILPATKQDIVSKFNSQFKPEQPKSYRPRRRRELISFRYPGLNCILSLATPKEFVDYFGGLETLGLEPAPHGLSPSKYYKKDVGHLLVVYCYIKEEDGSKVMYKAPMSEEDRYNRLERIKALHPEANIKTKYGW